MASHKRSVEDRLREMQAQAYGQNLNALPASRRMAQARAEGQLAPEESYTQRQLVHKPHRVEEARATVNSRLRSKEEFPQG